MTGGFRFDADTHTYTDATGAVLPHITGLLEAAGWIDTTWLTEAGRDRGTAVHELSAEYDLRGLDPARVVSAHRGYLLAYIAAMKALRPRWTAVEVPCVHPVYRFGGRPDRVGRVLGLHTIAEIKSGAEERHHAVQTAMQAILVAGEHGGLPAEDYQRIAVYLKPTGRYVVERHTDRRDFGRAMEIVRATCQRCTP